VVEGQQERRQRQDDERQRWSRGPAKVCSDEDTRLNRNDARAASDDLKVLSVDLEKLPDGVYGVDWDVTSEDGHVIDGTLGSPWTGPAQEETMPMIAKPRTTQSRRRAYPPQRS
jgi:hypothetical protein